MARRIRRLRIFDTHAEACAFYRHMTWPWVRWRAEYEARLARAEEEVAEGEDSCPEPDFVISPTLRVPRNPQLDKRDLAALIDPDFDSLFL